MKKVLKIWITGVWGGITYVLSDLYHTGYLGYNLFEIFYELEYGLRNARWEVTFGREKATEMIWRELFESLRMIK